MHKTKRNIVITGIVISVVVCALLTALFYSLAEDLRREVSVAKSGTAVRAIREKFLELAAPVQRDLELLAQWGQSGLIDLKSPHPLQDKLLPLLDSLPVVTSLVLADTDGREYFILKEASSRMIRTADIYGPDTKAQIYRLDENGKVVDTQQAQRSFDPRTRPWFAGALQANPGAIFWTEPYRFKTVGQLGITASVRWRSSKNEGPITVAAMDILLEAMQQFMVGLKVTPKTQLVLVRNDGMVMSPHLTEEKGGSGTAIFFKSADLFDGPVKNGVSVWKKFQDQVSFTHPFTSRNKKWWASFQPLQAESPRTWVGVLIPEADLTGDIRQQWFAYAIAIGALFILSIGAIFLLLRRYDQKDGFSGSRTMETNAENVQTLIARGESNQLEFKSTIRTNLKSGKKDKAIELAWLKSVAAFMNSEGGTLIVGVDDNGTIRGIDEDGFENQDKCLLHVKNLIHEHIGSEFAGSIDIRMHVIDEKIVVSLTCRQTRHPIFLKVGQNEDFFVRSGPSTTKLSMSKMVAYLDQRK